MRLYIEEMGCDYLAETELVNIPAAGSTEPISFSFTVPCDLEPGEYTLYALADADGEIQEEDEANNLATTGVVLPVLGDLDCNGDVDRSDLNIILSHRNQPASVCPECDLDSDGMITALDARTLALLCTRPRCACE